MSRPYQKIMKPLAGAAVFGLYFQVIHLSISVAGVEQSPKATKLQENLTQYAFLIGGVSGMGFL